MFSGNKTLQQSPSTQAVRVPVRPHSRQAVRVPVRPQNRGVTSQFVNNEMYMNSRQGSHSIVQPANLGEQPQQYLTATDSSGKNVIVRARPHPKSVHDGEKVSAYAPLEGAQPNAGNSIMVPLGELSNTQSVPQQMMNSNAMSASQNTASVMGNTMSNMNAMLSSNAMSVTQDSMNAMMNTNAMSSAQDAQQMMNANSMSSIQDAQQMMNTQSSMNAMATSNSMGSSPIEGKMLPVISPLGSMATSNTMGSSPIEGKMLPVISPLGSTDLNVIVRPRPKPQGSTSKTTILYYDPAAATVDGQLYLPEVVYDEDGNEVDLQALQASSNAEIFLEPPPLGLPGNPVDPPREQISRQELQRYAAEPPVQDQYIIIATVAVMALLVGALSARRLRSRNFLSSCIENESVEDEVAYDAATTNGDYSTFAGSSMFRGDLEKFDV